MVFGPLKAAGMARDLGRFVNGANRTVEEFKGELLSEEVEGAYRTVEEKDEVQHSGEELKNQIALGEEGNELPTTRVHEQKGRLSARG